MLQQGSRDKQLWSLLHEGGNSATSTDDNWFSCHKISFMREDLVEKFNLCKKKTR